MFVAKFSHRTQSRNTLAVSLKERNATMRKIEIPTSIIKLILTLIGCTLAVALGFYLAKNPEYFISFKFRSPQFIRIVGIITVCLFSLAWLYIIPKLFDRKPGLILDEKGITDNSSFISVGLILWKDIVSIRTGKIKSNKFLIIDVCNPEKYVKGYGKVKTLLLKANIRLYGTPLSISSNGLKYNFKNLEKLIQTEFEKYKEKPNS